MTENLPAPVPTSLDDFFAGLRALGYAVNDAWQNLIHFLQPTAQAIVRAISQLAEACRDALSIGYKPKRSRPRNTRVQMVQAKRKAIGLSQDGKCCGLRTRKASHAFRLAEQRFYDLWKMSDEPGVMALYRPKPSDFERMPARKRRKLAKFRKRVLKRGWQWMDSSHVDCKYCRMSDQEDATCFAFSTLTASAWEGDLSTPVENHAGEVHHG